ncbi:MAG: hypothetical protein R6U96_14960 [Promethearchaeia archaeon]
MDPFESNIILSLSNIILTEANKPRTPENKEREKICLLTYNNNTNPTTPKALKKVRIRSVVLLLEIII